MNDYNDMINHIHPDDDLIKDTKEKLQKKSTVYHSHKLVYVCMLLTIVVPISFILLSKSFDDSTAYEDELITGIGNDAPIAQADEVFEPVYTKELTTISKETAKNAKGITTPFSDFYIESSMHFLQQEQNTIYSPSSTAYALAMLTSGTTGTTKEQLETFFGYDQLELESILHQSYVSQQTEGFIIDNSIWFDDRHTLNIATLQSIADLYYANCFQTDFQNQEAVAELNEYVRIKSNGMLIPSFEADPNQAIKLLNVTTLDARWNTEFDVLGYDYEDRFVLSDGTKANVDTLHAILHDAYYEKNDQYEMSDIYLNNGFYMRVILPDEKLPLHAFVKDQDLMQTIADTRLQAKERHTIDLKLPTFSISNKWNLSSYLKKQGVSKIFQPSSDFDLMGTELYVNEVEQLAAIEVTRYGLRASAATSVDTKTTGLYDNTDMIKMSVNRPFLYMIFSPNHELVFLGTVYDPSVLEYT